MTRLVQATPDAIREAAALLRAGEVVAFPTETVYGLGADATNDVAIAKIYEAKQRPAHNPLIIHVASLEKAKEIAIFDSRAETIATAMWPGPITLVLPLRKDASRNASISPKATAGLETVALRVPAHPTALALLEEVQCPVAAPSANPSGSLSPTTALHVAQHLKDKISLVLAGGASQFGVESTILDLTQPEPQILRPGAISLEELTPLLGEITRTKETNNIKSPGQLRRHYATRTPLRLNAVDVKAGEALLGFGKVNFIGVEKIGFVKDMNQNFYRNLSPEGDLHQAAAHLYAYLHELDESGATGIAVMKIPETGLGVAINDRLQRASATD